MRSQLSRWRLFTQQQHVNSLAPLPLPARASVGLSKAAAGGARGMWAMLHNLGSVSARVLLCGKGRAGIQGRWGTTWGR